MTDDLASALDGIRERHALAVMPDPHPVFFGALFQIKSHLVRADVPRLLAAVEAALKLADDWDAESDRLDDLAERRDGDEEGRPVMAGPSPTTMPQSTSARQSRRH